DMVAGNSLKHILTKLWEAIKREWRLSTKLKVKETGLSWDPIKKTVQASDDWWDVKIQLLVSAWAPSQNINDSYNNRDDDEDNDDEKEGLEDELNDESTPPNAMRQMRRKVNEIAHRNNVPSISTCLTALKQLCGLEVGSDIFFIATRLMTKRLNREIFMEIEDFVLQLGWLKTHSLADVSGVINITVKCKKKMTTLITSATCVDYFLKYVVKISRRISRFIRNSWANEILNEHPIRCYQQLRMKKHVFLYLYDVQYVMQKRDSNIQEKPFLDNFIV
ncbi:hypothetical protein S83_031373, partial [Arachis hypogaea]